MSTCDGGDLYPQHRSGPAKRPGPLARFRRWMASRIAWMSAIACFAFAVVALDDMILAGVLATHVFISTASVRYLCRRSDWPRANVRPVKSSPPIEVRPPEPVCRTADCESALRTVRELSCLLQSTSLSTEQQTYVASLQDGLAEVHQLLGTVEGGDSAESTDEPVASDEFNPRDLVNEMSTVLQKLADRRGVRLCCQIDSRVPVSATDDPSRLRRILLYLTDTALKYSAGPSLAFCVLTKTETKDAYQLQIEIEHQGATIPAEALDRLNGDVTSSGAVNAAAETPPNCTGVGLTIARHLLKSFNGIVKVENLACAGFVIRSTILLRKSPILRDSPTDLRDRVRLKQEQLTCNHGDVLDLSLSGMRIAHQGRRAPAGELNIRFDQNISEIELRGEVMWSKRIGNRVHECGIRFLNTNSGVADEISRISMQHRYARSISTS